MNALLRSQPAQANVVHPHYASSLTSRLSTQQFFEVELGLFLLAELLPTSAPDALPSLLNDTNAALCALTARQRKYLKRGKALLSHCMQPAVWASLLERYAVASNSLKAFDISHDHSRFWPQTVGFAWNRIVTLRQLLA